MNDQKNREEYDKFDPPKSAIFCYDNQLMEFILDNYKTQRVKRFYGEMYLLTETDNQVAIVGRFGIGAPVSAVLLEELIAFGTKYFISIGTAGALQKNLAIGDLVVCDKAIRDEGTSYHYLRASKFSYSSERMVEKIKKSLKRRNQKYIIGTSWTIDAPYRETVAEAKLYQQEGVATVDMEASALFAIAKFRGVEIGAIFTISDSLAELQWMPKFHTRETRTGLEILSRVAIAALMSDDY